jgi:hypothetical protein
VGPPAGFILERFRQSQDGSFRVVRLSFGNFQNGLIAFVQQTLGHLGYPSALRFPPASTNPGAAIGSNVFRQVKLKNQAGYLSGPVRETNSVRTASQSDCFLTFGKGQKQTSDRLAHRGPGAKSRALLTGVNAPIAALQ